MATAKKVPPPEYNIELTLSAREADTLFRICGHLVGTGPLRVDVDSIFEALEEAGLEGMDIETPFSDNYGAGVVRLGDE